MRVAILPLNPNFSNDKDRKVWQNTIGQTACVRKHLRDDHEGMWREIVISQTLKGWRDPYNQTRNGKKPREPFSLTGFNERLLKWIVVDDQVRRYYFTWSVV